MSMGKTQIQYKGTNESSNSEYNLSKSLSNQKPPLGRGLTGITSLSGMAYLLLFFSLLLFTACSSSSDDDGPAAPTVNNINSNLADANPVVHRLEFPKVKGGSSLIITHFDNGEVNYSVEWDTVKRSNRWSAYEMYSSNRESHTSRYSIDRQRDYWNWYNNQYPTDPDLHCSTAWTSGDGDPFMGSGYDHGHLCPSADRLNSRTSNIQTFYLTNMMPQLKGFNAGVWENMENWVRNQIKVGSRDTLFIVKGGTIDNASQIKSTKVHGMIIPKYYYMALLMKNSSGYRAMGFWVEHKESNDANLAKYVVNIDTLEQLTGIDFFCNLPDNTEEHVESLPLDNVLRAWSFK